MTGNDDDDGGGCCVAMLHKLTSSKIPVALAPTRFSSRISRIELTALHNKSISSVQQRSAWPRRPRRCGDPHMRIHPSNKIFQERITVSELLLRSDCVGIGARVAKFFPHAFPSKFSSFRISWLKFMHPYGIIHREWASAGSWRTDSEAKNRLWSWGDLAIPLAEGYWDLKCVF